MKTKKKHSPDNQAFKNLQNPAESRSELEWLIGIMRKLLSPEGCPWDREQTLDSLKPFLLEEAYEVLDAIDKKNKECHIEELGDLLLQIVFQSELAGISFSQIINAIGSKLIRRHPHVFGDEVVENSHQVLVNWEKIKKTEKAEKKENQSILSGVPRSMPALLRAHHLSRKAAKVGFEWPTLQDVRAKVQEELEETDEAVAKNNPLRIHHEIGDLLFAIINWARMLHIDPELCLRDTNSRFETRFHYIEESLQKRGRNPAESSLEEMEQLWAEAKKQESIP